MRKDVDTTYSTLTARIAAFAPFCLEAFPAPARYLCVNPVSTGTPNGLSWESGYHTVTAAVNASAPGDEIWVIQGT